jgi:hypothetical protein
MNKFLFANHNLTSKVSCVVETDDDIYGAIEELINSLIELEEDMLKKLDRDFKRKAPTLARYFGVSSSSTSS